MGDREQKKERMFVWEDVYERSGGVKKEDAIRGKSDLQGTRP